MKEICQYLKKRALALDTKFAYNLIHRMKSDFMPPTRRSALGGKSDFPRGVVAPENPAYPDIFRSVLRKKPAIYYRGNFNLINTERSLAVVGSRNGTPVNQRNLEFVLGTLNGVPITIVSGLAIGLDALAHELALRNNLPTIAVLGSSVEDGEIYPPSNEPLAQRILEADGLLLSPFPPGTAIQPWNFPIRNQLIAALSRATLIASAAKKSGALITARLALEYGKDVFVIPGYVDDPLYEGSNRLLRDGATPILDGNDIRLYFGIADESTKNYATTDDLERKILSALREAKLTADELARKLRVEMPVLMQKVTSLELKGWITAGGNGTLRIR